MDNHLLFVSLVSDVCLHYIEDKLTWIELRTVCGKEDKTYVVDLQ